jgi:hypothetical protein
VAEQVAWGMQLSLWFGHCYDQRIAPKQNRVLAHDVNRCWRTSAHGSGSWIIDSSKFLTRVHEHSCCEQVIVSQHVSSLIDTYSCWWYHQSMMVSCIIIHPPDKRESRVELTITRRGLFKIAYYSGL